MTTQARTLREAVQELGDSIVGRLGIIGFPILQELQAALALPDDGGWISVEERLPETTHNQCIVTDGVNSWARIFAPTSDNIEMVWQAEDITHWRPLPAPPQPGTTQEGEE